MLKAQKEKWYIYRQAISPVKYEGSFLLLLKRAQRLGQDFDTIVSRKSISDILTIWNTNPEKDLQERLTLLIEKNYLSESEWPWNWCFLPLATNIIQKKWNLLNSLTLKGKPEMSLCQ